MLCSEGEEFSGLGKAGEIRRSQGWQLEIWDAAQVSPVPAKWERISVYSPQETS